MVKMPKAMLKTLSSLSQFQGMSFPREELQDKDMATGGHCNWSPLDQLHI